MLAFADAHDHYGAVMVTLPLSPQSSFSRTVFKLIRPHISRERWPAENIRAVFEPMGDGLWLEARFEGFSASAAALATQLVRDEGVGLVLQSPAAWAASCVARSKRWRDFCLFSALPLLFVIPFMGALPGAAMQLAAGLFFMDMVALLWLQGQLARNRSRMTAARFVANIPGPGQKIQRAQEEHPGGNDGMPEV